MIFKTENTAVRKPSGLDSKWLQDAIRGWEHRASMVLTAETGDHKREEQLLNHLHLCGHFSKVYRFSPFAGLQEYLGNRRFRAVTSSANSDYDPGLRNEHRELGGALRYMDGLLRQQKGTAFILRGLDLPEQNIEKNIDLINALREWAFCDEIMTAESIICLVFARPLSAIDQVTLDQTILVRPDLASAAERSHIVRDLIETKAGMKLDQNGLQALVLATAGLNLHQTRCALLNAYFDENGRRGFRVGLVKEYKAGCVRRSNTLEIEEPSLSFDDVGGYETAKRLIRERLIEPLLKPERMREAALKWPRGALLYGPPGTGKTLFARALAGEVNLPFIHLKPENYGSIYVYGASLRVREAMEVIEQVAPALVFTDEVDRLAHQESECGDGASQERNDVLKQLLARLGDQDRKWIAIGTTNVPNLMNRAFTRSGRFSLYIPFLYPDLEARRQILLAHLGLQGHRPKPSMNECSVREAVETMTSQTEFYAGSDLEELVNLAKLRFFQSTSPVMTGSHLLEALEQCRVDTDARREQEAAYRAVKWEFSSTPDCLPGVTGGPGR